MSTALLPTGNGYYTGKFPTFERTWDWVVAPAIAEARPQVHASAAKRGWADLARRVRAFGPDIVVLIARKVPRLYQRLQLDFGREPIVVSDLAIPFIHRFFRHARVAIVDDVVNVGSTLQYAHDRAQA